MLGSVKVKTGRAGKFRWVYGVIWNDWVMTWLYIYVLCNSDTVVHVAIIDKSNIVVQVALDNSNSCVIIDWFMSCTSCVRQLRLMCSHKLMSTWFFFIYCCQYVVIWNIPRFTVDLHLISYLYVVWFFGKYIGIIARDYNV